MSFYSNSKKGNCGCSNSKSTSTSNSPASLEVFSFHLFSVRAWKVTLISLCFLLHMTLSLTEEPHEQEPEPEKERQNMKRKPFVEATEFQLKFQRFNDGKVALVQFRGQYNGPLYQRQRRNQNEQNREKLTTPELVRNADAGLQVHRHHVTTKDNYKLTLFQIKRRCGVNPKFLPILFQHGLMGTSDDFLLLDPDYSFPIALARYGYDVWLSNSRGNEYSKSHEYLNTYDPRYWDFSFHEMGKYDLPVFDYINRTSRPVVVNGRKKNWPYLYWSWTWNYNQTFPKDGPVSFIAIKDYLYGAAPELCTVKKYGRGLCGPEIFTFLPDGSSQIRKETVPVILAHSPSSTSMKTLIHFLQLLDADYFREFDYGPIRNFQRYNQTDPLKYAIFRVMVASNAYYGETDNLIEQKDAEKTVAKAGDQYFKGTFLVMNFTFTDFLYSETFFISRIRDFYAAFGFANAIGDDVELGAPGDAQGETKNTTKLISNHTSSGYCTRYCAEDQE